MKGSGSIITKGGPECLWLPVEHLPTRCLLTLLAWGPDWIWRQTNGLPGREKLRQYCLPDFPPLRPSKLGATGQWAEFLGSGHACASAREDRSGSVDPDPGGLTLMASRLIHPQLSLSQSQWPGARNVKHPTSLLNGSSYKHSSAEKAYWTFCVLHSQYEETGQISLFSPIIYGCTPPETLILQRLSLMRGSLEAI